MRSITKFKTAGGLSTQFFQYRYLPEIYKWLEKDSTRIYESHRTASWIDSIDFYKSNRLAGQTYGELDIFFNNQDWSPNPYAYAPFGKFREMLGEVDLAFKQMQRKFPNQVRLYNIDKIIFVSYNPIKETVKWKFHDIRSGWYEEEVDLSTSIIVDGLKTGNYDPKDPFQATFEIQEFFQDPRLYEYYEKRRIPKDRRLPILCGGRGLGALQIAEEDTKIIFGDHMDINLGDIHNNDRMALMRKKYIATPPEEKDWLKNNETFSVALFLQQRKLGRNTKYVNNLFDYIETHYPDFPEELLKRLVVSFNDDGSVKLLAVMVRSYGYKKQNALPGLEHPNYRNIQLFDNTTGYTTIAPTNIVGSFMEQVTNADLFLYDQKIFDLKFSKANNTQYFMYRPEVQFRIRQMVKNLTPLEADSLKWIDSKEYWDLLDTEIITKYRSITRVPRTALERQGVLLDVYKKCPPVVELLKAKPDLEAPLSLQFMTFADKFQG